MTIKDKLYIRKAIKYYGHYYREHEVVLREIIRYYFDKKEKIAVWGGGLKGMAFCYIIDQHANTISCIFDINEKMHGTYSLTGHFVTGIEDAEFLDIDVVFVMNNQHEAEIAGALKNAGRHVALINIDSVVLGGMTLEETIQLYGDKL